MWVTITWVNEVIQKYQNYLFFALFCSLKELKPNLLYFAVFDGHGGPECADFCSEEMENHILYWLARGEKDLQTIFQYSFQELNNSYARHIVYNCPSKLLLFILRSSFEYAINFYLWKKEIITYLVKHYKIFNL